MKRESLRRSGKSIVAILLTTVFLWSFASIGMVVSTARSPLDVGGWMSDLFGSNGASNDNNNNNNAASATKTTRRSNSYNPYQTKYNNTSPRHTGYIADISKHNGSVNFYTMKSAGVEGVMMRAAYGNKKDIRFDEYSTAAEQARMPYGVYQFVTWHYDTQFDEALRQCDTQINTLLNIIRGKKISGYVALDLELENGANLYLNKTELTYIANYYMNRVQAAGYRPILYCSISWLCNKMNQNDVQYPLWIAYYNDTGSFSFPDTTYGNRMRQMSGDIVMWQYTSKANGPQFGVESQYLDMNRAYRTFTK
ncbi:MAG: hypothetical protein IJ133_02375 [Clostridia bacterium]|nr:hypothetical protein [Clostridia bacterium]